MFLCSHLLALSGGVIPIILLIAVLTTLSGCAIEKRDIPLQQESAANYADHPLSTIPYNRKDWPHWIDADGDCQNTRQELLIATSQKPVQFKDSRHCTVIYGEWYGVYTGKTFTKASDVDIDHINRSKSDKAPHEWLPPLKSYWCEYGERWERIKDKYRLWYDCGIANKNV